MISKSLMMPSAIISYNPLLTNTDAASFITDLSCACKACQVGEPVLFDDPRPANPKLLRAEPQAANGNHLEEV